MKLQRVRHDWATLIFIRAEEKKSNEKYTNSFTSKWQFFQPYQIHVLKVGVGDTQEDGEQEEEVHRRGQGQLTV